MEYLSKFTSAYLNHYFKNKDSPYERWELVVNGVRHVIDSDYIIDLILKSDPKEQKLFAESLRELEEHGCDVKDFLKHLARMSIPPIRHLLMRKVPRCSARQTEYLLLSCAEISNIVTPFFE